MSSCRRVIFDDEDIAGHGAREPRPRHTPSKSYRLVGSGIRKNRVIFPDNYG